MTNETYSSPSTLAPHPRLFVRWFVQYNPMFTASALCVLGGVLLLSCALGKNADVALTGVLELYQWLVIGTAALLYRRLLERRPAAILGVIQLAFMIDPTLQLSSLAGSASEGDTGAVVTMVLWVVSFGLKVRALEYAFHLRLNHAARAIPIVGAVVVALVPNARLLGVGDDFLPAALATVVFVVGAAAVLLKPTVSSKTALGEVGQLMFPRLVKAAAGVGVAGVVYQCWNATLAIDPGAMLGVVGALALVGAVAAKREAAVVWLAAGAFAAFLAGHIGVVSSLSLLSAALLAASRSHPPRIFVAGLFAAAVAGEWTLRANGIHGVHVFESPATGLVLVVTGALVFTLWKKRAWSAVPALGLIYAKPALMAAPYVVEHGPQSSGAWGALLLGAGFVLLPAGVVAHRRLSRLLARSEAALALAATSDSPATPAAIPQA